MVFLSTYRKMPRWYFKFGHDHFLPHGCQLSCNSWSWEVDNETGKMQKEVQVASLSLLSRKNWGKLCKTENCSGRCLNTRHPDDAVKLLQLSRKVHVTGSAKCQKSVTFQEAAILVLIRVHRCCQNQSDTRLGTSLETIESAKKYVVRFGVYVHVCHTHTPTRARAARMNKSAWAAVATLWM